MHEHRRTPNQATLNEEDDMADQDHTSKPIRGRRNQTKLAADAPAATAASDSAPPLDLSSTLPTSPPPQTLEEAISNVRALLLEVRAMLHCLSEVLLYADDADTVMHAEVAQATAKGIGEAAAQLDLVKLRPLIEAIRQSGGGSASNAGSLGDPSAFPCQVREPTPVYHA